MPHCLIDPITTVSPHTGCCSRSCPAAFAARREHPIHTFVVPSPRSRGEREPLRILHRTIVVRLSPMLATGIKATSGLPPQGRMNPSGSTRSPGIRGRVSKDPPCSRRESLVRPRGSPFPLAWSMFVPPDGLRHLLTPRVGHLRPSDSVHPFPFPRYRRPLATAAAGFCPGVPARREAHGRAGCPEPMEGRSPGRVPAAAVRSSLRGE